MLHKTVLLVMPLAACLAAGTVAVGQHQHAEDFLLGASGGANPQLKFEIDEEALSEVHVLSADEFGGFSTDSPGFDHVDQDEPAEDLYRLGTGAQIWLQIFSDVPNPGLAALMISPAMYVLDLGALTIIPYQEGPTLYREVYLGSSQVHKHVSWFVDSEDPAYDPGQCVWEVTCRFVDKGSTNYSPSEPFTLRFSLHPLVPGDFDCDADVDEDDLAFFEACHSGPAIPVQANCSSADLDGDTDADATDFAILQRCWSGAGVPGNPHCRE